ncbi:MAG: peptidoglycan bridge formation glycyltransferase FemA/FemB family protein [Ardenticatenia bacterium]|nr:peptidoglycan bridge formation glycyltransferase FemA/FemB family protein [Ardenticatenia bacterium]
MGSLWIDGQPEEQVWDEFVAAHPYGNLLQGAAWAAFKARWGWSAHRLLVRRGAHPVAGVQVFLRALPLGHTVAYVPRGPVAAPHDEDALSLLWPALHRWARSRRAVWLTVEPNWPLPPEAVAPRLRAAGFRPAIRHVQPRATLLVDLRPSPEEILARMKQKWRYNIRLSHRKGVRVRLGQQEDFGAFYALMQETGHRDGFPVRPHAYYRDAWQAFQPAHSALLLAEHGDDLLAALLIFRHGQRAYYLYGASTRRERHRMPNHALQWAAMQWAKEQGCQVYDLWGIPPEAATGHGDGHGGLWGVYRFKRGFGGCPVVYPGAFDAVYIPPLYTLYRLLQRRRRPG